MSTSQTCSGALALVLVLGLSVAGCDRKTPEPHDHPHGAPRGGQDHPGDDHGGHGHGDEIPLGTVEIGGFQVEVAQGHGEVEPGKEMHLVVKLPYSDKGATVIRAWIGTGDRFASLVARAGYAPSHDDYDLHAVAPDPLPDGVAWWIEIEKPDGSKHLGSIACK